MALPVEIPNDVTPGITAIAGRPVVGPGADQDSSEAMLGQLKDAENALKERYANPNWFNVAAGFFKPQLGGFTASLGSASQALGENLEKQRANEIPLFNVRAQMGALAAQRKNREAVSRKYSEWVAAGSPKDTAPDLKNMAEAYGAPEFSKAVDAQLGVTKEGVTIKSIEAGTATEEKRPAQVEAQTVLTGAQTKTENKRPEQVEAQTELTKAETATEKKRPEQVEAQTDLTKTEIRNLLSDTPESKQRLEKLVQDTGLTKQEITNAVTRNGLTEAEIRESGARLNLINAQIPETNARTTLIGAQTGETRQRTSFEAQNAMNDNLFLVAPPGTNTGDWSANAKKTREVVQKLLVANGVYTQDAVKNLSNTDLMTAFKGLQQTYVGEKLKNRDSAGNLIEMTDSQLRDIGTVRDLTTSDRMSRLLGIGSGASAVSALYGYIANPNDGTESSLNRAVSQLSQENTPEGRQALADFDVLKKSLQKMQLSARTTMENPSVASQTLTAKANPSTVLNTQAAMVKMIDLMAHDLSYQNRMAKLRAAYEGDWTQFQHDPKSGYSVLKDMGDKEHSDIAVNPTNLNKQRPDFYNPSKIMSLGTQTRTAPAAGAPAVEPAAAAPAAAAPAAQTSGGERPFHWEYNAAKTQRRKVYD